MHVPFLLRFVLSLLLLWVLAGCGYKGNLYLPGEPPAKEGQVSRPPAGE
ncbi:MAG: lipoprotein [Magnetococcus sp. XQGC-1]